jgi:hypothetical protein
MFKQRNLFRKMLIIIIIILFIGNGIVSSTGNKKEDFSDNKNLLESVDTSGELLLRSETAFAYCANDPSGELNEGFVTFEMEDPGYIENINISNPGLVSCGAWACNEKFFVCDSTFGYLWKIDPYYGNVVFIGGGGVGLNGLTYDTCDLELYGCTSNDLYMIDQYTGEQTLIGSFSSGPDNMVGLASNCGCVLYGWDTGTDNLWIIDKKTAECELVGSLEIDLNSTTDGHFQHEWNALYLATYTTKGQLYYCDKDTGECYLLGDFQGGAQLTAFVIPIICFNIPPTAPIIIGYDNNTLSFYSNDPNDDAVKYFIDWDDGEVTETGWYLSGKIVELKHAFAEGVYYIRLKAMDWLFESPWSEYLIIIGNQPPRAPIIDGPTSGKPRIEYQYTFNSTDLNKDPVMYFIDWGDNTTEWTEYSNSGEEIILKHIWSKKGEFIIKAKAIDINDTESSWSYFLVKISRSRVISYYLYEWLLDRFPMLERFLKILN